MVSSARMTPAGLSMHWSICNLKPPLGAGSQRACVRRTAMHVAGFFRVWFQQTIAAVQQCGDRAPCRMSGAAQRMASVTSRAQRSVRRSSPPKSRKRGSDMLAALGKDSTLSPNRPIACQPGHDPAWQPHEQDAATRDERPRPAVRRNGGFVHAGSRDGNGMNRVSYSSRRGGGACGHYQCAGSACRA